MKASQLFIEAALSDMERAMQELMKEEGVEFSKMTKGQYEEWVKGHELASAMASIMAAIATINP